MQHAGKKLWTISCYLQLAHSTYKLQLQSDCLRQESNLCLQRAQLLPCVCAYTAFLAREARIKPIRSRTYIHAYNKHMHTRQWPCTLKPNSYSLVEGTQTIVNEGKSALVFTFCFTSSLCGSFCLKSPLCKSSNLTYYLCEVFIIPCLCEVFIFPCLCEVFIYISMFVRVLLCHLSGGWYHLLYLFSRWFHLFHHSGEWYLLFYIHLILSTTQNHKWVASH